MCSFHYSWFSKENRYWKEWSSQNNWWGVQVQNLMLCIHTLMGFLDMPFSFWPFFFFFFNLIFVDICRDWICYFCMIDTLISSNFSLSASSFAWQSCPSSSHDFFYAISSEMLQKNDACGICWFGKEQSEAWRSRWKFHQYIREHLLPLWKFSAYWVHDSGLSLLIWLYF